MRWKISLTITSCIIHGIHSMLQHRLSDSCLCWNFSIIILIYELKIIPTFSCCRSTENSHLRWCGNRLVKYYKGVWVVSNVFILWQRLMNRFLFQFDLDILNNPRYFYLWERKNSVEFGVFLRNIPFFFHKLLFFSRKGHLRLWNLSHHKKDIGITMTMGQYGLHGISSSTDFMKHHPVWFFFKFLFIKDRSFCLSQLESNSVTPIWIRYSA